MPRDTINERIVRAGCAGCNNFKLIVDVPKVISLEYFKYGLTLFALRSKKADNRRV